MSGGYRTRCESRRYRVEHSPRCIRVCYSKYRGAHDRWQHAALMATGEIPPSIVSPTRRQRRTWTPNGEKARANRLRDESRRREVGWDEVAGKWVAKGTVIVQAWRVPSGEPCDVVKCNEPVRIL